MALPAPDTLINLPYSEALERLRGRDVFVRVLTPPYPGVGKGRLRVVRVEETSQGQAADAVELVITYDGFERLDGPPGTFKERATPSSPKP